MQASSSTTPSQVCAFVYLFTGKERDAESGLDYFGARYYASTMGRFMSPDWADKPEAVPYSSLDNPQSLNLYGYVNNNPFSKTDADGHCPICLVGELAEEAEESPAGQAVVNGIGVVATAAYAYGSGLLSKSISAGESFVAAHGAPTIGTIDGLGGAQDAKNQGNAPTPSTGPSSQTASPSPPGNDKEGAQSKPLSKTEIKNLEKNTGQSAHEIKSDALGTNKNLSKHDIHKNSDGSLTVKPKGSSGKGEETGLTTEHLKKPDQQ
jgi:RHS repeat-associated protein